MEETIGEYSTAYDPKAERLLLITRTDTAMTYDDLADELFYEALLYMEKKRK